MSSKIAIVDGASFVLPYDFQLVAALTRHDVAQVDFYCSNTKYNMEFLNAMRSLPGVELRSYLISGSVVNRFKGVAAYVTLLFDLWRKRALYSAINFQFSILWPVEVLLFFLLRKKLIFTVHNAVPHGFRRRRHLPTIWLANIARTLIFPSEFTRAEFLRRYGERNLDKATVLPHGLLPVVPDSMPVAFPRSGRPRSLIYWSTIKPYKGIELFVELARSEAVRSKGVALEIYGAWSDELKELKDRLIGLGVDVHDEFMGPEQLLLLLSREETVFLLPYREASQSGALYSLLHHGRYFICSDVGDLGAFMRRWRLDALLLRERSVEAVLKCLDHLERCDDDTRRELEHAQQRSSWDALVPAISSIYAPRIS